MVSQTNNAGDPDVQLENDKAVSRQHCKVHYDAAAHLYTLEILAKKGVGINGGGYVTPSDPRPVLNSGDELTIGKTKVVIFTKPKPVLPKKKKKKKPQGSKRRNKKFGIGDSGAFPYNP